MDVLVAYDISTVDLEGERRLHKVAAVCERYGVRVQYSVFECRLGEAVLERMMGELADTIDHRSDSVRIYRFPGALSKSCTNLGREAPRDLGDPWIL